MDTKTHPKEERPQLRDHSEITSVFSDFHRARPGGITTGQLLGHTEDPENRWSGRSVAGQLSPRWDKPSGSGMWQEVFRASIAEMESRQLAELIFESSLSGSHRSPDTGRQTRVPGRFISAWSRVKWFCPGSLDAKEALGRGLPSEYDWSSRCWAGDSGGVQQGKADLSRENAR